MSFYLFSILSVYILPIILLSFVWTKPNIIPYKSVFFVSIISLITGISCAQLLPESNILQLTLNTVQAIALIMLLIYIVLFSISKHEALFWQAIIIFISSFTWVAQTKISTISATNVLNTELILNITSLCLGFILVAILQVLSTKVLSQLSRWGIRLFVLLVIIGLLPISGNILLLMMKLQVFELTQFRLSFVAKVTNFYWVYTYLVVILLLICDLVYFYKHVSPLKIVFNATSQPIDKRKAKAKWLKYHRLALSYLIAIIVALSCSLFWDLVASRPVTLSDATRVKLADDNFVHINIDKKLIDGKLHRFAWVASDGKLVRFFIINRYPDRVKLGVVFDACILCGDQGYVQKGNQVICLACGVHIFIPSIGKSGGCNPVPISQWQQKNNQVLISKAELESGLRYFSTVIEMDVTDPVNGEILKNTTAEYKYNFGGKTYFFSTEYSYKVFIDNPEKYLGGL